MGLKVEAFTVKHFLCWCGIHGEKHHTQPNRKCVVNVTCERCGKVLDSYYEHALGDWEPVGQSAHPCEYERNCTRCGKRPERTQNHTWSDWEYVAPKQGCISSQCGNDIK